MEIRRQKKKQVRGWCFHYDAKLHIPSSLKGKHVISNRDRNIKGNLFIFNVKE